MRKLNKREKELAARVSSGHRVHGAYDEHRVFYQRQMTHGSFKERDHREEGYDPFTVTVAHITTRRPDGSVFLRTGVAKRCRRDEHDDVRGQEIAFVRALSNKPVVLGWR